MRKKILTIGTAALLAGSITFSSCIGSFNLTKTVYDWNQNIGNQFVNELVFLVCVGPVYGIATLIDGIVLNSIEFWTGSNPMQAGIVKEVKGENGNYTVKTLEDGYEITNEEGQQMSFIYDKESNVWSSVVGETTTQLVKIEGNNAVVYLPNGNEKVVELNANGVLAFRQYAEATQYLAAK